MAGETMKQTEEALLKIGILFDSIKLGMDVVLKISEKHVFTDSIKSGFDLAETHENIIKLTMMGIALTEEAAEDIGFRDYERILKEHMKDAIKKAKEEN